MVTLVTGLLLLGSQLEFLKLEPWWCVWNHVLLDRNIIEGHGVSGSPGEACRLQQTIISDIPYLHVLVLLLDVFPSVAACGTGKGTIGTPVGLEALELVLYPDVFV